MSDGKKKTKAEIKKLEKALLSSPKLVWDILKPAEKKEMEELAKDYKAFLDVSKTERAAAREIVRRAEEAGFKPMNGRGKGGKYHVTRMGKVVMLAIAGKKPVTEGARLIISHIDAPRLDLKPRPVYEDAEMAMLKTHYYGGIKKYQWLSRPLALHGYVVKDDGTVINLVIGEDDNDPVLTIADLLPHLSGKVQGNKKLSQAVPGEKLNLLVGSLPLGDDDVKNRFKLAVLDLLNKKWGIVEEDFISAEFEAVPAGRARDVGLDSSMIGGYGQDDRISAYCTLAALLKVKNPERPVIGLFVDREETGSDGATGAKSRFLESLVTDLMKKTGQDPTWANMREAMMNTKALSADVEGAMNPDYQEVHEKNNAARLGYGPCVTRYTGSRGKYGASEASADYVGWLRGVFNKAGVVWQSSLLGKVDEGGGGTVAMFLAEQGMDIVDCGPSLLAMHSPFEIAAKTDLFMSIKAFHAFYQG